MQSSRGQLVKPDLKSHAWPEILTHESPFLSCIFTSTHKAPKKQKISYQKKSKIAEGPAELCPLEIPFLDSLKKILNIAFFCTVARGPQQCDQIKNSYRLRFTKNVLWRTGGHSWPRLDTSSSSLSEAGPDMANLSSEASKTFNIF